MDLKIFTDVIEPGALEQINRLLEQPAFKNSKVRIMPDVHQGMGCVVGFTGDLGDKVIPNVVGVDIGCGILCVEISPHNLNLELIDQVIHKYIPTGFSIHQSEQNLPFHLEELYIFKKLKNLSRIKSSLGTLGGGNHFIEIGKNDEGRIFLTIHTGSRNLGKQVSDLYQKIAIENINNLSIDIPNDLAYLVGEERNMYLHDMRLVQIYASHNRMHIANTIIKHANLIELDRFETIHNYIGDDNIVRKGAVSAYKNERLVIPLNMRDGTIYGVGLGNSDWNYSGPHGAGRVLSRREAKRQLELSELKKDMKGIYTTTLDETTIDESPRAYKKIHDITKYISDTIDVKFIIKPIYNFKAAGND